MKRQLFITIIIAALTFGLGWLLSDMSNFAKGVKQDVIRLDNLKTLDSLNGQKAKDNLLTSKHQVQPDTILNDDFELVIKRTDGTVNVWRKFNPKKTFKDLLVTEKFNGQTPKQLNFITCKYGKLYKTVSRQAADNGAVFAGHYAFTSMGCGTGCQISTIIDLKTGNVYAGPEASVG